MLVEDIQLWWPIVSAIVPFIMAAFMLWMKSQFVTKAEREFDLGNLRAESEAVAVLVEQKHDAVAALVTERHEAEVKQRETLGIALSGAKARITMLEGDSKQPPTRSELSEEIGEVAERLSGLEASVTGLTRELSTQNSYVRTLVENAMKA